MISFLMKSSSGVLTPHADSYACSVTSDPLKAASSTAGSAGCSLSTGNKTTDPSAECADMDRVQHETFESTYNSHAQFQLCDLSSDSMALTSQEPGDPFLGGHSRPVHALLLALFWPDCSSLLSLLPRAREDAHGWSGITECP